MRALGLFAVLTIVAALCACGGGGGSASAVAPGQATTATPTAVPASSTVSVNAGSTPQTATFGPIVSGYLSSVTLPATTNGSGPVSLTLESVLPLGAPTVQSARRLPKAIGGSNLVPLVYIALAPTATVTFPTQPAFAFTLAPGVAVASGASLYLGVYDANAPSAGWTTFAGPATVAGANVSFIPVNLSTTFTAGDTYVFVLFSNTAMLAVPTPTPSPSPTPSPTPMPSPTGTGVPLSGHLLGPGGAWGPLDLATTFNFPVQSGFNGAGMTVAIVIDSGFNQSDLSAYLSYFTIPTTLRTIALESVDGASTGPGGSGQLEATLDVETVAGLAPGANIIVYIVPDLSNQSLTDGYNQVLSDARANIVSMSFGGCEYVGENAQSTIFAQGVTRGMTFVAAAGDHGDACFTGGNPQYQFGVSFPSSDPNVIGVGGTETYDGNPFYPLNNPVVWNDTFAHSQQSASGGGVSTLVTLPSYQAGLAGASSTSARNTPDVAEPGTYDAQYLNGSWAAAAGTSWGAPTFAALLSEVYQYCTTTFNNAASIPYDVFGKAGYSAFIDVTSGNNTYTAIGGTGYTASTGYDNASGIGVPLGMPFANTLCPNRVPAAVTRAAVASAFTTLGPNAPVQVAAPPNAGLGDLGRRSAANRTRVQLVLRPTPGVAANEQAVIGVLQSAGFTIVQTFADHLVVDAQAPSATVEQFFATQLHDVQGAAGNAYTPVTNPMVPAALAPYVAGVTLDSVVRFRP